MTEQSYAKASHCKLKTLKDIKGIYSNGSNQLGSLHRDDAELRQAAIQWIKEISTDIDEIRNTVLSEVYETKNGQEQFVIIAWIKHFFNITKEDLK